MNVIQRIGRFFRSRDGRYFDRWLPQLISTVPALYSPLLARELPAVKQGVRLLGSSLSALPCRIARREADGSFTPLTGMLPEESRFLYGRWSDFMTASTGIKRVVSSMAYYGTAGVYMLRNVPEGPVVALIPLWGGGLTKEVRGSEIVWRYDDRRKGVTGEGLVPMYPDRRDLMVFEWEPPDSTSDMSISPFSECWPAIRAAVAANRWAGRYFDRGALPELAMQSDGTTQKDLSQLTAEQRRAMDKMHANGERFVAVPKGFKLIPLGGDPLKAQLLEVRRFGVEESARCIGLPAILVGDLSKATYNNVSNAMRLFAKVTLTDLAATVQDELSCQLWPAGDLVVRFDLSRAVRAPRLDRYKAHRTGVEGGFLAPNEARADEDLEPKDGGDELRAARGIPMVGLDETRALERSSVLNGSGRIEGV